MKIIVFDLDETIGYFTEYGIFWNCLSNYLITKDKPNLTQYDFDNALDLFNEFLRPNMINILNYLKKMRLSKCFQKMYIYTNNQAPLEWANHIVTYFEDKIKYKLFDQIVSAFKVNGKIVEIGRTSQNKSYKDFIKCTRIPINSEICFLDDSFYPDMVHNNIYYINVIPYLYDLNFDYMIEKFKESENGKKLIGEETDFQNHMLLEFKKYNYKIIKKNPKEYEIDKILGKQIMVHLSNFFNKGNTNNNTRKNNKIRANKTRKNIHL